MKIKINQSFIKRISGTYCPKKVKAELDGEHKRTATDAMIKGQYFEWLLFNTKNREGQIPVMAPLKSGAKSTDQIRIEAQAENFFEVCKQEGIKFYGTDRTFYLEMFGVETFGTWDGYGLYKGKPVVIDIKLPGNIHNKFGDFCWGDISRMDLIQAKMYMESGRRMDDIDYSFLYMIFDYKTKPEHVLHFVPYQSDNSLQVQSRIDETLEKIHLHESEGWPAIGSGNECKECPFSDSCPSFVDKAKVKKFWKDQKEKKQHNEEDLIAAQEELNSILSDAIKPF